MADKYSNVTHRSSPAGRGIRDVARVAGVSIATVSRSFNAPERVQAETRDRVLDAAKRLHYVPDNAARALSSQRHMRIGALIPSIEDSIFASFVTSLRRALGNAGYALILGITEFSPEHEGRELRSLIESGVDAVVFCGEERPADSYDLVNAHGLPYLVTNVFLPDSSHPNIGYDNFAGARDATRFLLDQGHARFGLMDFPAMLNDRAGLRLEGFMAALSERGAEFHGDCHIERPYGIEEGRIGLRTLLNHAPDLTAIFCGNDVLAFGALFEASHLGRRVPDDLSIVGFYDLDLASHVTPALTTVSVRADDMGSRTAEILMLTLAGKPTPHATRVATNLVIRGTTGPAPKTLVTKESSHG